MFGRGITGKIRPAHRISQVQEHLGNAAHPGAAYANKVQVLDYKFHNFSPGKLRKRNHFRFFNPFLAATIQRLGRHTVHGINTFDHVRHRGNSIGPAQCPRILRDF